MPLTREEFFMKFAIEEAEKASALAEVPVGAVIVMGDEIISSSFNTRETDKNALFHAEIKAIDAACKKLGGWRLHKCEMFVTLEPCPMCAGAIINSRIKAVYFGAKDEKAGAFGTKIDLCTAGFNHKPIITGGICEKECAALLSSFFESLRKNKNGKDDA